MHPSVQAYVRLPFIYTSSVTSDCRWDFTVGINKAHIWVQDVCGFSISYSNIHSCKTVLKEARKSLQISINTLMYFFYVSGYCYMIFVEKSVRSIQCTCTGIATRVRGTSHAHAPCRPRRAELGRCALFGTIQQILRNVGFQKNAFTSQTANIVPIPTGKSCTHDVNSLFTLCRGTQYCIKGLKVDLHTNDRCGRTRTDDIIVLLDTHTHTHTCSSPGECYLYCFTTVFTYMYI